MVPFPSVRHVEGWAALYLQLSLTALAPPPAGLSSRAGENDFSPWALESVPWELRFRLSFSPVTSPRSTIQIKCIFFVNPKWVEGNGRGAPFVAVPG